VNLLRKLKNRSVNKFKWRAGLASSCCVRNARCCFNSASYFLLNLLLCFFVFLFLVTDAVQIGFSLNDYNSNTFRRYVSVTGRRSYANIQTLRVMNFVQHYKQKCRDLIGLFKNFLSGISIQCVHEFTNTSIRQAEPETAVSDNRE
jgi:hypothetical protein